MKQSTKERVAIIVIAMGFALMFVFALTGCASEQFAKNLQGKSIVGDGFVTLSKISVSDPETGSITPEIKTLIVSGKMQTILKDSNLLTYNRNSSSSVFNASCVTTSEQLTISLPKGGDMASTLEQLSKITKGEDARMEGGSVKTKEEK